MTEQTKKCTKCGETKNVTAFGVYKRSKDGLRYECKKCRIEFCQNHRDKECARSKMYYLSHTEQECFKSRIRSENSRTKDPRVAWAKHTLKHHFRQVIVLTIEELVEMAKTATHCPVCGCQFNWMNRHNAAADSPSLDRKYNDNYISSLNCWIICHRCNAIKCDRPLSEFISIFQRRYGNLSPGLIKDGA